MRQSFEISQLNLARKFLEGESVTLEEFYREQVSVFSALGQGVLHIDCIRDQGLSNQQILLWVVSQHGGPGPVIKYKFEGSRVRLEIGGVEIALEVLLAEVGDLVVSFLNPIDEAVFNQRRQTIAYTRPFAIDVASDRGRPQFEPGVQHFQNPLISRILHPVTGFSHHQKGSDQLITSFEMYELLNNSVLQIQQYCGRFYIGTVTTAKRARVSRDPDCLGSLSKCDPVLRTPGSRGSREPGTKAMYEDNSRGNESPDTTSEQTRKPTPSALTGFAVRCAPKTSPRRKVVFEPTGDGEFLRLEFESTGCAWREVGCERCSDATLEFGEEIPDDLARAVLEKLFVEAFDTDGEPEWGLTPPSDTLEVLARMAFDDEPVSDAWDAAESDSRAIRADGGTTWTDLTAFQRDVLEAVVRLERDEKQISGQRVKEQLEVTYGSINHGRLYPNLDTLVEAGLVEKGEIDRRTNSYRPTDCCKALLSQRVERLADACDRGLAATDGGQS